MRLATGWTTEGLEFKSQKSKEFSFLRVFQTSSGAHLASYPVGTEVKAAEARTSPLISNYCQRQGKMDLYIHSSIRLHGVVLK
jgi:hypothetical protein